jgi:myo-inositol 2-dehydrogenase/D-chiro-inositol 1-dehydrogenase
MSSHSELRLAVIGAGRIGRIHARDLAQRVVGAQVVAIADPRMEAAREVADRLHIPQVVGDHQELLGDPSIDAIAICSSSDTHGQIISEAAQAGKHIFCEKPVACDLAQIDQALSAVARAGVKLQVGFNRRFDPSFRRVREMVAAGEIGQPHILRITSRDPAPPPIGYVRVSGGIFFDMTIHDFDMARYLMGSEVVEVYAVGGVRVDPAIGQAGDIDTAVVTLCFENGAYGTIDNSRQAVYGYDQRVEVLGSGGLLAAENPARDSHIHANAEGVHTARPPDFFLQRYAEAFVAEMQAFVDSIHEGLEPLVTGKDGRAAVVLAMAAQRSLDERRPVRVATVA